ncbi:MAG: helix-hairpin-helix domain-containing protein [Vicinamibacterales bacterium]
MTHSFASLALCSGMLLVSAYVAVSASPSSSVGPQAPPNAEEPLSPEDQAARTTFEMVCSTCHESAIATTTLRTRQEWSAVLDLMVTFGASASDAQFEQVQRYLGRRYGRVNLNRAPADELRFVLDVTPEVAEAIVAYRSTMRFTAPDDLKNIPGFDAARIEALKTHLQF